MDQIRHEIFSCTGPCSHCFGLDVRRVASDKNEIVCTLTDDRQVEPGIARRRVLEVYPTPVDAGVVLRHVIDGQHSRFGEHAEVRPALQHVIFPMGLVRVRKLVSDVHAAKSKTNEVSQPCERKLRFRLT
jgi:hypothetical protein